MVMANGSTTTEKKLQFKKRMTVSTNLPDAPEGGWELLIPKGTTKITEKDGDPVVNLSIKLVKAHEEENESSQGAVFKQRVRFYALEDTEHKGAASANYRFAKGLCDAIGADFDVVYPKQIESSDDLHAFINAVEGKPFEAWTVHSTSMFNGEEMVNINVRFKKPGAGLVTKGADDEDDERPGRKAARKARR